jgi:hypothetical protein
MYYLIQNGKKGEHVLLRGERLRLEGIARQLRQQMPHLIFRVTDRPDTDPDLCLPLSFSANASDCRC